MTSTLEEPVKLRPGYAIYARRGVAVIERGLMAAEASTHGPIGDPDTWLALSDAICFKADILPPDLVLIFTRPYVSSVMCDRAEEVTHDE